jgi:hypothetical protein
MGRLDCEGVEQPYGTMSDIFREKSTDLEKNKTMPTNAML